MGNYDDVLRLLLKSVETYEPSVKSDCEKDCQSDWIPIGISNRHIHLSQRDLYYLFGEGYELQKLKDLSQPGQYACKETLTICGPKGAIEKVRILGPTRSQSQIEVLLGDCFKLGVKAPGRLSGDLTGTPGITLVGPKGSIETKEGLIAAERHIHMTCLDAKRLNVADGDVVSIEVDGPRGGIYRNVTIRATDTSSLECHLDTEESNGMGITPSSKVKIIK